MRRLEPPVTKSIEGFTPRTVSWAAGAFARELTAAARPATVNRAKAFLFAASRLGAFCESAGLDLRAEVALHPSVIERCCHPETTAMSPATRRTVRTNLRARPAPRRHSRGLHAPTPTVVTSTRPGTARRRITRPASRNASFRARHILVARWRQLET